MKMTVKVEGLREIAETLRRLPKAVSEEVQLAVLTKRAEPIAETARQLAPVDHGDLQGSITVSPELTKTQRAKHRKDGPDDVEVFIGPGAFPQAHLQEFGTVNHPPQPFMRPAWDQHKGELLEGLAEDLWQEIEKAVGARGARGGGR